MRCFFTLRVFNVEGREISTSLSCVRPGLNPGPPRDRRKCYHSGTLRTPWPWQKSTTAFGVYHSGYCSLPLLLITNFCCWVFPPAVAYFFSNVRYSLSLLSTKSYCCIHMAVMGHRSFDMLILLNCLLPTLLRHWHPTMTSTDILLCPTISYYVLCFAVANKDVNIASVVRKDLMRYFGSSIVTLHS